MRMLSVFSGAVLLAATLQPASSADVNTSEIKVGVQRVFPGVQIRRPIVVTHANDGSDRIFIASQLGVVHILENDEEVEESAKSDREQMREYVDKVAGGHGAEKKSTGDNGDSGKSPVASANNMGGTSANILKGGEAGSGDHAGLGDLNAKDQDGGNINVPGGKASKAGKSEPGHGAEKKGKPEAADNKKSVVGK